MNMTRRALLLAALVIPVAGTTPRPAAAAEPQVYAVGGVAIAGYDPVAYFTEGRPVRGASGHSLIWHGATWYFVSAETMEAFEMNPYAYAPQYGGYCAYEMSRGALSSTEPDAFSVVDGRLYLTHSLEVRAMWAADVPGHIALADAHWPRQRARK